MTKARTLADFISDGNPLADGTISVSEVSGAAPLASPTFSGTVTVPNIVTAGNVDGRDVSVDGTKLDGVEASADVTDATNVTAAGALMDSELTNIAAVKALNQGLATTDEVAFDNTSLNAIATDISDTAVDVFVYRTANDSDGGSWRKRTQHTSWYNEAASSTRGSRKEFPAVAIIVAESSQVTIYDGDDPDMPMWMVFNSANNYFLNQPTASAVHMLNGKLAVTGTASNNTSLALGDFVSEFCQIIRSNYDSDAVGIINRNSSFWGSDKGNTRIINNTVNDVAMTVLPNAPIDAATGLPVPTIAVATSANVSIIRDNGTVVDITYANYNDARNIYFNSKNHLIFSQNNSGTQRMVKVYYDIPSSDLNNPQGGYQRGAETVAYADNGVGFDVSLHPSTVGIQALSENSIGTSVKLILTDETTPPTSTMLNFITSDHQTGWQNGAIKLATLSDTDDTNVTGAELVTNGTFASDTTGWTAANSATVTHQSGRMRVDGNVGTANQAITTVVGKSYTVSADLFNGTSSSSAIYVSTTASTAQSFTSFSSPNKSVTFTANATTTYIIARVNAATNTYIEVDNVSVRLAEEDRSVNGNGLQVFGTVTKTAVATGADLVGYSGFSASNYLQQPYNSSIMPSTNSFCVTGWYNQNSVTPTTSPVLFVIGSSSDTNKRLQCAIDNNNVIVLWTAAASGAYTYAATSDLGAEDSVWHCVSFIRQQNGKLRIYRDGVELALAVDTSPTGTIQNINWTDAVTSLGAPNFDTARVFNGSMALWRFSHTVPSPEQIAKMYNDEKHLFQAGAQATLYAASPASGSPDAVTALAYDDTTDLLHVGTDNGRSVFQGLRRVDNTTDAVGAAISASNGLVVEE